VWLPHLKREKAAWREAAFEEGGVVVCGLSGRQLPQHVNGGGGSVHGGSVAAKLSVQPVDLHG